MRLFYLIAFIAKSWRNRALAARPYTAIGHRRRRPSSAIIAILALIFLAFTQSATADPLEDGLEAYSNGNYKGAVSAFETSLHDAETAAARHNLALSYYKLEQQAEAAWQIERALILEPHNREYRYKLDALRQQLGLFTISANWFKSTAQTLTLQQWVLMGAASFWIALASILLLKMNGRSAGLGFKFLRAISLVGLSLSIAGSILNAPLQHMGILIIEEIQDLHAAPASASPVSGTARPAERAQRLDKHGEFVKIETEGGATGWITQDAFRLLIDAPTDT